MALERKRRSRFRRRNPFRNLNTEAVFKPLRNHASMAEVTRMFQVFEAQEDAVLTMKARDLSPNGGRIQL